MSQPVLPPPEMSPPVSPPSTEMEQSVAAVEKILNYSFNNKKLLEEALTHSSCDDHPSYQRLEFVGDAALGLALANYFFLAYPSLDAGELSLLRAANTSTEKFARVAVRHGLYSFLRRNAAALDANVEEFVKVVEMEDHDVVYGGTVKAPKVLADIVESVAAAVYVDVNFDLQRLWVIFRGLLEPIVTLKVLRRQPQPVTLLFAMCQRKGQTVEIKMSKDGSQNVANIYIDDQLVASQSSKQKDIAKLNVAKLALEKLGRDEPFKIANVELAGIDDEPFEIENAKQKLKEVSGKRRWLKPVYSNEKVLGPAHDRKYVCSVQILTPEGTLFMMGDEKTKLKEAENSAAALMIRALQGTQFLSHGNLEGGYFSDNSNKCWLVQGDATLRYSYARGFACVKRVARGNILTSWCFIQLTWDLNW